MCAIMCWKLPIYIFVSTGIIYRQYIVRKTVCRLRVLSTNNVVCTSEHMVSTGSFCIYLYYGSWKEERWKLLFSVRYGGENVFKICPKVYKNGKGIGYARGWVRTSRFCDAFLST